MQRPFALVALAVALGGLSATQVNAAPKPFSIVLLPASYAAPATLERQVEWIRSNEEVRDIAFVVHSGDMVRDGTDAEWEYVDRCFRRLDGVVPYAVATGNHDVYPGTGLPRARSTAAAPRPPPSPPAGP